MTSALLIVSLLSATSSACSTGAADIKARGSDVEPEGRRIYAAVFLNRGHVSGGGTSNIGFFVRQGNDTTWKNLYHPNLFTFGIGFWTRDGAERWYIAGGNGLHRSTDRGKSWRVLTDWRTEEVLSVALDPLDSTRIYIATPLGVFRSTDDGKTWQKKMRGMKKWFVQQIVIDRSDRNRLYAACEDDLYLSTDGGGLWAPLNVGVPGIMTVFQHPVRHEVLLVGTEDDGVRVSTDGGRAWKSGAGLPATAFYSIRSTPDGGVLLAGGFETGLWKSVDLGATWTQVWTAPGVESIFALFIHPDDARNVLIGTSGQGVFESLDGGSTWRPAGLHEAHVKQIEIFQ